MFIVKTKSPCLSLKFQFYLNNIKKFSSYLPEDILCVLYQDQLVNPLTPNDPYSGRTAALTSKVAFYIFIQQIQVLNILNMVYTLRFFPLQNAVCFIILAYLVPVLFTFYIQSVLKLKK
jgi:hypothetical protein